MLWCSTYILRGSRRGLINVPLEAHISIFEILYYSNLKYAMQATDIRKEENGSCKFM